MTDSSGRSRPPMPGADDETVLEFYSELEIDLETGPCPGDLAEGCPGTQVVDKTSLGTATPLVRVRCDECGQSHFRDQEAFLALARGKLADYHTDQRRRRAAT